MHYTIKYSIEKSDRFFSSIMSLKSELRKGTCWTIWEVVDNANVGGCIFIYHKLTFLSNYRKNKFYIQKLPTFAYFCLIFLIFFLRLFSRNSTWQKTQKKTIQTTAHHISLGMSFHIGKKIIFRLFSIKKLWWNQEECQKPKFILYKDDKSYWNPKWKKPRNP